VAGQFSRWYAQGMFSHGERRGIGARGRCAPGYAKDGQCTTRCSTRATERCTLAAASEWHGSAIWRSTDMGRRGRIRGEGRAYEEGGKKSLEGLDHVGGTRPRSGRRPRRPGSSRPRRRRHVVAPVEHRRASRAVRSGTIPANQPPGHLDLRIETDPATRTRFWAIDCRAWGRSRRPIGGSSWNPRGIAGSGTIGRGPTTKSASVCHKLVRSRADGDRMYKQNNRREVATQRRRRAERRDHRGHPDGVRLGRRPISTTATRSS